MDATTLRIILILVGAVLLLLLYLWERRRMRRLYGDDYDMDDGSDHYGADDYDYDDADDQDEHFGDAAPAAAMGAYRRETGRRESAFSRTTDAASGRAATAAAGAGPQAAVGMIVQVYVVAEGRPFPGDRLLAAAESHGLVPGDMGIFHRQKVEGGTRVARFSMANLVTPGTFPFAAMRDFRTRGVALFAQLSGTPSDLLVFDELVEVAAGLADELGGVLQQQDRSVLDDRQLRLMRARVRAQIRDDSDALADDAD